MKNLSLRGRLVKTLLLQMTAAALLSGGLALAFIYHEVDEVYDATLVQFSRSLASMPAVDTDPHNYTGLNRAQDSELAHKYERKISYRILRGDKVITTSTEGPDMEGIYLPPGFSDLQRDKKGREEWRIYTLPDEKSGLTIEVAEKYEIRRELTLQLLSSLLIPGLFFILGAVIAIWWGTSSSLKILKRVSKEVKSRAADDLSPIDDHDIPVEIQALTSALNELFGRIETSFAREREFTDNAAHELRTPLAAIKTQAQTLLRSENLTQAGHDGLENLIAAIDRATEMTETLLSFARLQGDRSESVPVVLSDIVKQEVAALAGFAKSRKITIDLKLEDTPPVRGVRHALALMIRNILHNAVKFSPAGGTVTAVLATEANGKVRLSVSDTGAGIPDKHMPHVFERFYRVDKSQSGSGLGLSIVQWVAETHQANIELNRNDIGGLNFSVVFGSGR